MAANGTKGHEKAVSVIVRWRGRIIDEKTAEGVESLTLGSGRECDFVVPEELGAGERFCVVEPAGPRWVVNVPAGWAARVLTGLGAEAGLQRRAQRSIFIGETERVLLSRGPVEIDVAWAAPKRAIRPAISRVLDRVFAGWLSMAAVFLATVVWVAVEVVKDPPAAKETGVVKQHVKYIQTLMKAVEKKPPPVDKKVLFKDVVIESNMRPSRADRSNVASRPSSKPLSKDEQTRLVRSKGVLGILAAGGGFSDKIFNPGLGPGVNEALSGMHGPSVASAGPGLEGLGGSRGGDGGPVPLAGMGGPGQVAPERRMLSEKVVSLAGKKGDDFPVRDDKTVVSGGLEKEVVGKVIRMHHQQAKYCYDRELTKNPNLYGKITIQFVIGGTGTVTEARVSTTEMNSEAVEECLIRRVKTWVFPQPRGGGQVYVTYPFVFTSAGGN